MVKFTVYQVPENWIFFTKYEEIIKKISNEKKHIVIGTDQNLDFLKIHEHTNTAKFLDVNLSNNLLPTISKPTRITHRSCTLIDNIYVSAGMSNDIHSRILTTDISDHLPCLTLLKDCSKIVNAPLKIESRKLDDENIMKIKASLRDLNWNDVSTMDANDGYDFIVKKIQHVMDTIAPKTLLTIDPSKIIREPWMTPGLIKSSKTCDKLFSKLAKLDKHDIKHIEYKKFRNMYNRLKKNAKKAYYANKVNEFRQDSKKLWKILKEITGKLHDKSAFTHAFMVDGQMTEDPQIISDDFCKFYSQVGKKYASKIDPPQKRFSEYMAPPCNSSIFFTPTTPKEIIKIVSKLKSKSSAGHDGISNILLKSIVREISEPLANVFNKSLESGIFPNEMKFAEVIPVYKAKEKHLLTNYRPVSLLPVISKILKKIVHNRLYSFLIKNELLYKSQFGFKHNHSTADAILEFVGKIVKGFEKGDYTLALFLDLSKAFDTLQHSTLLRKMENFGVRGMALKWFKSYLSERKMYVKYGNKISETRPLEYGVPQGSVLGPLCFILLTNDLAQSIQKSSSILFADDTTIYASGKNVRHLVESIKHDLNILVDWFRANKLSLNLNKTNFVLFRPKAKKCDTGISLSFGDVEIKQEKVTKFLGVYLDECLNWDTHIKHVCSKMSKNLYLLNSVKHYLPTWSLKNLYFAYINSHMVYGLSIWGPMAAKTSLKRIRTLQNKALRAVVNAKYNASIKPILKRLKILSIDDQLELELSKISFKYSHQTLPDPVSNLFRPNAHTHTYRTRARNHPRIENHKTSTFNKSFLCRSPSIWAGLPYNVKNKTKKSTFIDAFKVMKISEY